jgi:hypothetical protein
MWPILLGGTVGLVVVVVLVPIFLDLPVSEDPTQRAGDGSGDEEIADPQGVFALGVEEGEVDGLRGRLWSAIAH